jgi:hypothetical protein
MFFQFHFMAPKPNSFDQQNLELDFKRRCYKYYSCIKSISNRKPVSVHILFVEWELLMVLQIWSVVGTSKTTRALAVTKETQSDATTLQNKCTHNDGFKADTHPAPAAAQTITADSIGCRRWRLPYNQPQKACRYRKLIFPYWHIQ